MSYFKIQRGLKLLAGDRTLAVQRVLDKNRTVQLENEATGEITSMAAADLLQEISLNTIRIAGHDGQQFDAKVLQASDEGVPSFVARMTETQRKRWDRNTKYVKEIKKQGVSRGARSRLERVIERVARQIGDRQPPSASTVIRWLKKFDNHGGNDLALLPPPSTRLQEAKIPIEVRELAWQFMKAHHLKFGGESLMATYRRFCFECKRRMAEPSSAYTTVMSRSSFRRLRNELSAYDIDRARYGAAFANHKWRMSIGGVYATRPLERVEMDHTKLDLYVIDDTRLHVLGRPTLTLLIDSYTKYVISLYVGFEGESLGRVSRAIKLALSPRDKERLTEAAGATNEWWTPGIWDCLVVDNGLAFQSPQLQKIANAIGCDLEFCPVRKPWFKPTVERYMLEVARILPVEGRPNRPGAGADSVAPTKTACVMFSDLCNILVKWVTDVLPLNIPERTLERPFDKMAEFMRETPDLIALPGLDELDLITALEKRITVAQGGVEFVYLEYRSPELGAMARRQQKPKFSTAMRYDPNDLGRIWVQDPLSHAWLSVPCMKESYANGTSLQQHRMIRKFMREKLNESGAYESLESAREAMFANLYRHVKKGKRALKSSQQLALLEGKTSFKAPKNLEEKSAESDVIIDVEMHEIPDFGAFNLSAKDGWETR